MKRSSGISKADLLKPTTATLEVVVDAFPASRAEIDPLLRVHHASE